MSNLLEAIAKVFKKGIVSLLVFASLIGLFSACDGNFIRNNQTEKEPDIPKSTVKYVNLEGEFTQKKILDAAGAIEAVNDVKEEFGFDNAQDVLEPLNDNSLEGSNFFRSEQRYKGVPVFGRNIIVIADENGNAQGVCGNYTDVSKVDVVPTLSQEDAEKIAKQYLSDKYKVQKENIDLYSEGLSIYSLGEQEPSLVWFLSADSKSDNPFFLDILVNAKTGEIVIEYDNVFSAATATGQKGSKYSLSVTEENGKNYLEDPTRKIRTMTYDFNVIDPDNAIYLDFSKFRRVTIDEDNKSAIDAAGNMAAVYDFYLNVLNRRQFDGMNSELTVLVNLASKKNGANGRNAHYYRRARLIAFSVSPNKSPIEFSTNLDVVAHEFTHGVTETTCGLIRDTMPSAINEALSDIMGEMAEKYVTEKCDFSMHNIRDIKKKRTMKNFTNSEDALYENSLIISHSAYIMWNGKKLKSNTAGFSKLGDGNRDAVKAFAKLWYGIQLRLTPDADFVACRTAAESSARSLLNAGIVRQEHVDRVSLAFAEVGIGEALTKTVEKQKNVDTSIPVSEVTLPAEKTMTVGEIDVVEPEIFPPESGYSIRWTSSDTSVATITPADGIVFGQSKGRTTLTATVESGGKTITKSMNLRVASKARDTILVLDVSGSMMGTPMDEMKLAAARFCEDLLEDEYNNRVGLVCYDSYISSYTFTDDLNELKQIISELEAGSRTNMVGGLEAAKKMMDNYGRYDSVKNIVIMADGLPNEGGTSGSGSFSNETGWFLFGQNYENAVVDMANDMKNYNIYSLGFFHSLYFGELENAEKLMAAITNKENGYYSVDTAENLKFAFGDIAENISIGSKIVINIACPVKATVSFGQEFLSSDIENYKDTASFGSLKILGKNSNIKVFSLDAEKEYQVDMSGTGLGEMNYSVNYFNDNEELEDFRRFNAVPLSPTTIITSSTVNTQKVALNIDKDGNGIVDDIWEADKNGVGETVIVEEANEDTEGIPVLIFALIIVVGTLIVIGTIVLIVVLVIGKKDGEELERAEISESRTDQEEVAQAEPKKYRQKLMNEICVLSGSMKGVCVPVEARETLYLGKDPKLANIVFSADYKRVSRLHCTITFNSEYNKYYVVDCSNNGTYLGDKTRLQNGKRVAINPNTVLILADEYCSILLK